MCSLVVVWMVGILCFFKSGGFAKDDRALASNKCPK